MVDKISQILVELTNAYRFYMQNFLIV